MAVVGEEAVEGYDEWTKVWWMSMNKHFALIRLSARTLHNTETATKEWPENGCLSMSCIDFNTCQ